MKIEEFSDHVQLDLFNFWTVRNNLLERIKQEERRYSKESLDLKKIIEIMDSIAFRIRMDLQQELHSYRRNPEATLARLKEDVVDKKKLVCRRGQSLYELPPREQAALLLLWKVEGRNLPEEWFFDPQKALASAAPRPQLERTGTRIGRAARNGVTA